MKRREFIETLLAYPTMGQVASNGASEGRRLILQIDNVHAPILLG